MQEHCEAEIERRCKVHQDDHAARLDAKVARQAAEIRRLRRAFKDLQGANAALRLQVVGAAESRAKTEKQLQSARGRLRNLNRARELEARKVVVAANPGGEAQRSPPPGNREPVSAPAPRNVSTGSGSGAVVDGPPAADMKVTLAAACRVLAVVLEWMEAVRREHQWDSAAGGVALIRSRCARALPALTDVFASLAVCGPEVQLPCVRFAYWCVAALADNAAPAAALRTTCRRLGMMVYTPPGYAARRPSTHRMFRSPAMDVRLVSTLLVLRTITRCARARPRALLCPRLPVRSSLTGRSGLCCSCV